MLKSFEALLICILIISFLVGCFVKGILQLNKYKWATFATPIGFFSYMAILQIGYMLITFQNVLNKTENKSLYLIFTKYTTVGLAIISLFFFRYILEQIKKYISVDFVIKFVISVLVFTTMIQIFKYTRINYRLDDINFYAPFIYERLEVTNPRLPTYIYQGYYIFIAVLWEWIQPFVYLTKNIQPERLPFVLWIPSYICLWMFSFTITDIQGYIREKIKNRYFAWVLWFSLIMIATLDYWYFQNPNTGNTLRRLPIFFLIILLDASIEENTIKLFVPCILMIGAAISFTSSSFFLVMILLYSYTLYAMYMKNSNWLWGLTFMLPFPLLMGSLLMYAIAKYIIFIYCVIILLTIIFSFSKTKWVLEKFRWISIVIMILAPTIIVFLQKYGIPSNDRISIYLENRTFFDQFGTWDQVAEIQQFPKSYTFLNDIFQNVFVLKNGIESNNSNLYALNLFFWTLLLISVILNFKKSSWPIFLVFTTVITFFNPFVMNFIGCYLTGLGYYRIADLIFNPIVFIAIFDVIFGFKDSVKYKYISGIVLVVIFSFMTLFKIHHFELRSYIDKEHNLYLDYNFEYHTSQEDLNVLYEFIDVYNSLPKEEKDENNDGILKVAMQVYGAQLFVESPKIKNTLEDRFAYQVIKNNEYERVFSRKYPGVELEFDPPNYEHACSLAFANGTDYVVLDAQYNNDLQAGLWPCTKMLSDKGKFHIIKIDKTYWHLMLKEGQTKKYKVRNNVVVGEDLYIDVKKDTRIKK